MYTSLTTLMNEGVVSDDIVRIQPGTYVLTNTLKLRAGMKLIGAGAENTILKGSDTFTIIQYTGSSGTTETPCSPASR